MPSLSGSKEESRQVCRVIALHRPKKPDRKSLKKHVIKLLVN